MNDRQHGNRTAAFRTTPAIWHGAAPPGSLQIRVLIGSFLTVFVAISAFAFGLASGVRGADVTMLALAVVTFAAGCVPLVLDQGRRPEDRHLLMALVSLVYMMHFVVPALMLYLPATGPIDASSTAFTNLMPSHVVTGQLMALLGLISLQGGYALPVGSVIARGVPPARRDWSLVGCLGVSLGFLALGWMFTLAGVLGFIPAAAGSGVTGVIATGRNYSNVLLTYAYLRHRSRLAALLIGVNVSALLLFGLITSDKQDALVGPALVVLTSMLLTKRIRARWIAMGFAALIVIYPASGFVRSNLLSHSTVAELVANPGYTLGQISTFMAGGEAADLFYMGFEATAHRIDGLGIASVIIRDTPSVSPFQHGRTLWLFFAAFVPRILWPGKPDIHIGQWITDVYGSGPHIDARTAPTPIGEFYLNFGVTGIVLGMMLLGIILRLAHETLGRRTATAPSILAQTIILVIFGIQFAGSVAGVYSQLAFTLIPLVLLHLAVRTFAPAAPASSDAPPNRATAP